MGLPKRLLLNVLRVAGRLMDGKNRARKSEVRVSQPLRLSGLSVRSFAGRPLFGGWTKTLRVGIPDASMPGPFVKG